MHTMKKVIILSFMNLIALVAYAQCDIVSYIVDPDGYVNVRADASSKSEIVTQLNSGTTVYYEYNSDSKWYRISLEKSGTPLGYIHSSRLAPVESTDSSAPTISSDPSAINLVLIEPGGIAKYLPMDKLSEVTSLTISGPMYETDVAIIKMCTNLKYLNLKDATISESEQGREKRKNSYVIGDFEYDHMPNCYIPASAFEGMKLQEVILPQNVKFIGHSAFSGCSSLQKVDLGKSLMIIERYAFAETRLSEIKFPKSLKKIKGEAFDKVSTLRVIDLSKCHMEEFSNWLGGAEVNANIGCLSNLRTVYMPQGMETFNSFVRMDCSGVKEVYVGKDVKVMNHSLDNMVLHFQSETAPDIYSIVPEKITNCTIYIPKNGNATSYYAKYSGNGNKIIQE